MLSFIEELYYTGLFKLVTKNLSVGLSRNHSPLLIIGPIFISTKAESEAPTQPPGELTPALPCVEQKWLFDAFPSS